MNCRRSIQRYVSHFVARCSLLSTLLLVLHANEEFYVYRLDLHFDY